MRGVAPSGVTRKFCPTCKVVKPAAEFNADRYHAQPDEAFHGKPEPLAADFAFNDSTPPPEADFTGSGGLAAIKPFRLSHHSHRVESPRLFSPSYCPSGLARGLPLRR